MRQEGETRIYQQVEITRMSKTDLDAVIKLGLTSSELQTGTTSPQFYSKETLRKWIQSPNDLLLVAKVDGEFAGFIISSYNPDSRDAYIHTIDVVEKFRRQGIGDNLLERTLLELDKTDCNHVFCLVKPDNKSAQKLFQKHGFTIGEPFHYTDRTLPR